MTPELSLTSTAPVDAAAEVRLRAARALAAANESRAGVFSTRDTDRAGLSPATLRTLLAQRQLRRVRRGWYALGGEASPRQRHLELVYAVLGEYGGSVVASHHSALAVHDVPTHGCDLRTVHVTRLDGARERTLRGLVVHAADAAVADLRGRLARGDRALGPAVPVEFAAAQTALSSGPLAGLVAADYATHHDLTTPAAVRAALGCYRGARGIAAARAILDTIDPACESVAETVARHIFHQLRFSVTSQFALDDEALRGGRFGRRADFRLVGTNLLIEIDGLAKWTSATPAASERIVQANQTRDAWLAERGWLVLHLYWQNLVTRAGNLDIAGVHNHVIRALRRPGAAFDADWNARLAAVRASA